VYYSSFASTHPSVVNAQMGERQDALAQIRECVKLDEGNKECFKLYQKLKKFNKIYDKITTTSDQGR